MAGSTWQWIFHSGKLVEKAETQILSCSIFSWCRSKIMKPMFWNQDYSINRLQTYMYFVIHLILLTLKQLANPNIDISPPLPPSYFHQREGDQGNYYPHWVQAPHQIGQNVIAQEVEAAVVDGRLGHQYPEPSSCLKVYTFGKRNLVLSNIRVVCLVCPKQQWTQDFAQGNHSGG